MATQLKKRTLHPVPDVVAELDCLDLNAAEKAALVVFCWSESGGDIQALKESITTAIHDAVRRAQTRTLEMVEQLVVPYHTEAPSVQAAEQAESIIASLVIMQNQVSSAGRGDSVAAQHGPASRPE